MIHASRLRTLLPMLLTLTLAFAVTACGEDTEDANAAAEVPRDQYPAGPFGTTENAIIMNHSFLNSDGASTTMSSWRADESRTVMLVSTSAGWCTACIQEQPKLQRLHEEYASQGLVVVVSMFETGAFEPADTQLAKDWKEQYELGFDVVADPQNQFGAYYDTSLTPMNMIVDLRSMQIVKITVGFDESLIESLIKSKL